MHRVFSDIAICCVDTVLSNSVHVDTELATEEFHIQIILIGQGFADNLMASSSFLDKGTVEGYNIVTFVSQLQVVQKFGNTCDGTTRCNDDLDASLFGILDGRKDFRSDFLFTVNQGTIDIDGD